MRLLNIYPDGKHCIVRDLKDGKAMKIFNTQVVKDWNETFYWGDAPASGQPNMSVSLQDATIIQNICWLHGLAPRVYEIVGVVMGVRKYFAQITDFVENNFAQSDEEAYAVYSKVKELGKEYGFTNDKDDVSKDDVISSKLVDFNTFHFTDDHRQKVIDKYIELARYGKIYYHNVDEFGLTSSPRDNGERVKNMKLEDIDFTEKSVIDFGCAGGFFTRYAKDKGASRVLGYDYPDVKDSDPVKAAYLVSNELHYWDIDYESVDLRQPIYAQQPADITFFLSMNYHISIPAWLKTLTSEVCIFEDNSKERNAEPELKKMFSKVRLVGHALDHGDKPIYHCFI